MPEHPEPFHGPYRRWFGDGRVEFLGYDGEVEWRGHPRAGVVFPRDYDEAGAWWWKYAPLSVELRSLVRDCRMSVDEAARSCAVPTEAAVYLLSLLGRAQPSRLDRVLETSCNAFVSSRAARA